MNNIDEALNIARKEVSDIAQYDNAQEFVNKCLDTVFINCTESLKWYTRHDRIFNAPKLGDQVFIGDSTGIVELVSGSTVYTIELDTDIYSTFYGLICRKQRNIEDCIYGRPIYNSDELIVGPKNIDEIKEWLLMFNITDDISTGLIKAVAMFSDSNKWRSIKRGHIGIRAQVVQAALICAGYSCGQYGANGYFNDDSVSAVKRFQKNNKMICDGIVGKAVAEKLFKGIESSSAETK